jgi:hypothetical protein
VSDEGYTVDIWITGAMIFGLVVVICNFKILTFSYTNTPISLFIVIGSIVLYIFSVAVVNFILSSDIYQKFGDLWKIANLYFGSIVTIVATTFMDLGIERYHHLVEVKEFRKMKKAFDQKVYEDEVRAKEEQKQAEIARANDLKSERLVTSESPKRGAPSPSGLNTGYIPLNRGQTNKVYGHSGYAFSQEESVNWFGKRKGMDHPQN